MNHLEWKNQQRKISWGPNYTLTQSAIDTPNRLHAKPFIYRRQAHSEKSLKWTIFSSKGRVERLSRVKNDPNWQKWTSRKSVFWQFETWWHRKTSRLQTERRAQYVTDKETNAPFCGCSWLKVFPVDQQWKLKANRRFFVDNAHT